MLMHVFKQALSEAGVKVWQVHFNAFMRLIHDQLHHYAGRKNPLDVVTRGLVRSYAVLCLDEFFVEDIADAMILTQLLQALLRHRITMMLTSNTAPHQLYADGLQRPKFLPAIHLLQNRLDIVCLDAKQDYRLVYSRKNGSKSSRYFLKTQDTQAIFATLGDLANRNIYQFAPASIQVQGRTLDYLLRQTMPASRKLMMAFDFAHLCGSGRSVRDYLQLASQVAVLALWHVPVLHHRDEDKARRLIALIDELYNQQVKLVIQAEVTVGQLYQGVLLQQPFQRTVSRIRQMCAADYPSTSDCH